MTDRMSDERLAAFDKAILPTDWRERELVDALKAERQRVEELEDALQELVSIVKIHSSATGRNFAWAELSVAEGALRQPPKEQTK